jgi:hypothetical protein
VLISAALAATISGTLANLTSVLFPVFFLGVSQFSCLYLGLPVSRSQGVYSGPSFQWLLNGPLQRTFRRAEQSNGLHPAF